MCKLFENAPVNGYVFLLLFLLKASFEQERNLPFLIDNAEDDVGNFE